MASLDDIPDELIDPDKKAEFLDWLESIPLTHETQLQFVGMWTRITTEPFTFGQIESLKSKALPHEQPEPDLPEESN